MKQLCVTGALFAILVASGLLAADPEQPNCHDFGRVGGVPAASADRCEVRVKSSAITGAMVSGDTIFPLGSGLVKFPIEVQNDYDTNFSLRLGFRVYSPDNARWAHAKANGGNQKGLPATMYGIWVDTTGAAGGGIGRDQFAAIYSWRLYGADGAGEDSVVFLSASYDDNPGIPIRYKGVFCSILLQLSVDDVGKQICIDSITNCPPT